MTISKFVLNKINFDNYKLCDLYTSCFMQLVSMSKISILTHAPASIVSVIQSNNTTFKTLVDLCKWKRCNVWIIRNSICYHIGENPPTHIIDGSTILPWSGQEYISHYHVTQPLYALSHYKVEDLKQIAMKLNIPISKTKKQLYSDIESFIKID
jgi:hypothetical protein